LLLIIATVFLSISTLPCTLQLEKAIRAHPNVLLGKELISTCKIMMG